MSRRANCSRPPRESVDDDLKAIFQRRRFSQPARPLHKPGGEKGARHKDNHRHDIFRSVDLEAEKRRAKRVIQACRSNNGEGDSRNVLPLSDSSTTMTMKIGMVVAISRLSRKQIQVRSARTAVPSNISAASSQNNTVVTCLIKNC